MAPSMHTMHEIVESSEVRPRVARGSYRRPLRPTPSESRRPSEASVMPDSPHRRQCHTAMAIRSIKRQRTTAPTARRVSPESIGHPHFAGSVMSKQNLFTQCPSSLQRWHVCSHVESVQAPPSTCELFAWDDEPNACVGMTLLAFVSSATPSSLLSLLLSCELPHTAHPKREFREGRPFPCTPLTAT